MAYSKLHSSIVNSSLWTEPDSIRILFITLLAMCDRNGVVYGTRIGINRLANIPPETASLAWETLLSPDENSSDAMRAPENQGRRIEEVPGGFKLLNFDYYRGLRNDDDRREQNRAAQARFKKKISRDKPRSAEISQDKPISEAEADTETVEVQRSLSNYNSLIGGSGGNVNTMRRPQTIDQCLFAAQKIGLDEASARQWFIDSETADWRRGDGTRFDNWVRQMTIHRDKLREQQAKSKSYGIDPKTGRRVNPRNIGVNTTGTDYAEVARRLRAKQQMESQVAAIKQSTTSENNGA